MKKIQVDEAERRALTLFDQWNDVTGYVDTSSGYCAELHFLIEDAVHIGIQMATFGKIIKNEDGEIARNYTEPTPQEPTTVTTAGPGLTEPRHYEFYVTGEDNKALAYKERGKWTIIDAEAALERLFSHLKPNYYGPA